MLLRQRNVCSTSSRRAAAAPVALQNARLRNWCRTVAPFLLNARAQGKGYIATATSSTTTVEAPSVVEQAVSEEEQEVFAWTKVWYPVAVVEELDPSRPQQVTLLGEDYVVWKDGAGTWRVFADRCPHRLAPLSEGRVEADGTLMCTYHAWRFEGSGACSAIPQAKDSASEAAARSNPRACATTYPTKEHLGLIWLWPEAGAAAEAEAAATPLHSIKEIEEGVPGVHVGYWRSHELPYGADYFLENVLDPAHVVVSHHNVVGNRYKDPAFVDLSITRPLSMKGGFEGGITNKKTGTTSHVSFAPPNLARLELGNADGSKVVLQLYCIPTRPGYNKHIGAQVFVPSPGGSMAKGIASIFNPQMLPIWFVHMVAPVFLHQDLVFLHWQEKIASQAAFRDAKLNDKYFCPITSDRMVLELRTWFSRYSPGGIPFKGEFEGQEMPAALRDEKQLFDTWAGHTRHCRVCRQACENMKKIRVAAWVGCALAAVQATIATAAAASAKAASLAAAGTQVSAAVSSAAWSLPPTAGLLWAVASLVLAGVAVLLGKVVGLYHYWPFSHADNH